LSRSPQTPTQPPGDGRRAWRVLLAVALVLSLVVAACGGKEDERTSATSKRPRVSAPGGVSAPTALGQGEGKLDLVAEPGHVEDGSANPNADWVSDFETQTGCQVTLRTADDDDEVVSLMRTGRYDGAAVPGDGTLRLIAAGAVAPVNVRLVPNYRDVFKGLKDRDWNAVDHKMYGVPEGREAHVLIWRKDKIPGSLRALDAVFVPAQLQPYTGKVTVPDDPMFIADAALQLTKTRPELGIVNPYELDSRQFAAVVAALQQQEPYVGRYWRDAGQAQAAFTRGEAVIGMGRQSTAIRLQAVKNGVPIGAVLPGRGSTGSSDTWMVAAGARHPNCMYRWLNHVIAPRTNARIAEWVGEAPANRKACGLTREKDFCSSYHADDESFYDKVAFWTTPTRNCGDARGAVCKDWADWQRSWRALMG
jgi:putative spermidine/putrescine transport system substrate-binding protein